MANVQINQLAAAASVTTDDLLEIENDPAGTPASEKATIAQVLALAPGAAGGTDVAVADGGTGASTAAAARTNLGLVIGTDVQAHSAVLDATTASFTTADETKLDAIEALADVTDEANVTSALDGATLTAVTVATDDKVVVQDTSDTDNIKTVTAQSIADLAAGGDGLGITAAIDNTRMNTGSRYIDVRPGDNAYATRNMTADFYTGGLVWVPTQTVSTMSIHITTAQAPSTCYISLHNVDADDGFPGTLAHSFGTFDTTATGTRTITGLSDSITAGWYYLLVKADTTGVFISCWHNSVGHSMYGPAISGTSNFSLAVGSASSASGAPGDLSAVNWDPGGQSAAIPRVAVT